MAVVTVTVRALDPEQWWALGWLDSASPKSQPTRRNVVSPTFRAGRQPDLRALSNRGSAWCTGALKSVALDRLAGVGRGALALLGVY